MLITMHQPDFLPWLGFFQRWAQSDLLLVLDDVQFIRRAWQNRDRIKTPGGPAWLTVPVRSKGRYHQRIAEVQIDNDANWRQKHLATIEAAYRNCPGFATVFEHLERVYGQGHELLLELNMDLLRLFAGFMDINTPTAFASEYAVQQTSTARLVALARHCGATRYLTGAGARDYLDEALFHAAGIEVVWQQYAPPEYPQAHGAFAPMLSALDFCMNVPATQWSAYLDWMRDTRPAGR